MFVKKRLLGGGFSDCGHYQSKDSKWRHYGDLALQEGHRTMSTHAFAKARFLAPETAVLKHYLKKIKIKKKELL